MPRFWTDEIARLWRPPDEPMPVTETYLAELEAKGGHIAEPKYDGRRGVLTIDAEAARAYSAERRALPVAREILDLAHDLGLPEGTALEVVWVEPLKRRDNFEALYLLDVLYLEWQWQGAKPLSERRAPLLALHPPTPLFLPEIRKSQFLDFFEEQLGDPITALTEGIVVKRLSSPLFGMPDHGPEKNPFWTVVKWRGGRNGEDVIYRKRRV